MMSLSDYCKQILRSTDKILPPDHSLGTRLVCPEYSSTAQEVKTYPLLDSEGMFAVCWDFRPDSTLCAAMYPVPEPFCLHYTCGKTEKTQLHTHDYIELAYIAAGTFRQRINGKDITFQKGDFILIDQNCLHQDYLQTQPGTILFFGISNDRFTQIMNENVTPQRINAFLQSAMLKQKDVLQYLLFRPGGNDTAASATEKTEELLTQLLKELYDHEIGYRSICKGLLLRLFHLLSSRYEFSLTREQHQTMSTILFEEVTAYLNANYNNVKIRDLTERFHFQEDYFNRLIKSRTGLTYSEYLQKIRIEKAEYLLLRTDKSIDAIAESIGYHNKGYFYKIFSEKHGMTPAAYRKQNKS